MNYTHLTRWTLYLVLLICSTLAWAMPARNPALGAEASNVLCASATHATGHIAVTRHPTTRSLDVLAVLSTLWHQRLRLTLHAVEQIPSAGGSDEHIVVARELRGEGSDGRRYALTLARNGYAVLRDLDSARVFDNYLQCVLPPA